MSIKKNVMGLTLGLSLLVQTAYHPSSHAQSVSADASSGAHLCQVSSTLAKRLSVIQEEEQARASRAVQLKAEVENAIRKDTSKDGIKKVLRIASAILYILDGDVEGFAQSVTGSMLAGSEDAIDLKSMTDAKARLDSAVQRQVNRANALSSTVSNLNGLTCEAQTRTLATAMQLVLQERLGYLNGSLATLNSVDAQINSSYSLATSYWKRPGIVGGTVAMVVGGLTLGFGGSLWHSGSRLVGPTIAFLGGIALTAGGVSAYTSHLEVVRARNFQKSELELLKKEMESQRAEITAVQSAISNLLTSLN